MRAHEYDVTPLLCMYAFVCIHTVVSCATSTNDFYFVSLCFMSTHKLYRFLFSRRVFYSTAFLPSKCTHTHISHGYASEFLTDGVSLCVPIFMRMRDII